MLEEDGIVKRMQAIWNEPLNLLLTSRLYKRTSIKCNSTSALLLVIDNTDTMRVDDDPYVSLFTGRSISWAVHLVVSPHWLE